jgi:hypothetical protein
LDEKRRIENQESREARVSTFQHIPALARLIVFPKDVTSVCRLLLFETTKEQATRKCRSIMDRFFKATTRFRELYRQTNDQELDHFSAEVELVGSSQDMSYHGFSFSDLVQSAQMNILVWITPHAYVVNTVFSFGRLTCWGKGYEAEYIMLKASCDRKVCFDDSDSLLLVALSCKELTSACNAIFSLLAISNVAQLFVHESSKLLLLPVSARTLSNFVKESHSLVHVQFD